MKHYVSFNHSIEYISTHNTTATAINVVDSVNEQELILEIAHAPPHSKKRGIRAFRVRNGNTIRHIPSLQATQCDTPRPSTTPLQEGMTQRDTFYLLFSIDCYHNSAVPIAKRQTKQRPGCIAPNHQHKKVFLHRQSNSRECCRQDACTITQQTGLRLLTSALQISMFLNVI